MSSVFAFTLIGLKKEKLYTMSLGAGGILFIIAGIILTPVYKSLGIAAALVIFEIAAFFLMNLLIDKKLRVNLLRFVIFPLIVSAVISVLFLYYINLPQILEIIIAIAAGVPLVLLSSGIGKNEINFIKRILI